MTTESTIAVWIGIELTSELKKCLALSKHPDSLQFIQGDPYLTLLTFDKKNFLLKQLSFPCQFQEMELAEQNFVSLCKRIFSNLPSFHPNLSLYEVFSSGTEIISFKQLYS